MSTQSVSPLSSLPTFAGTPRRIALFRALHLGDLLLALPGIRAIRGGFPRAEITLIGLAWAAEFAARFPRYLDRFVEYVGYPGLGEVPLVPERTARFLAEQRAYGYDVVVAMHGNGCASLPFCLELGAPTVVSYYDASQGEQPDGITLGAPYPADQPEVLRHLGLARLLGCSPRGLRLEFPVRDADRAEARALLGELEEPGALWVALHPGSRAPSHRWPASRFAEVADALAEREGARVVLVGGRGEEAVAWEVASQMRTRAYHLAGRTSLSVLAAILQACALYIGNDTGPAHLAVAVDTPSITIFGPADHHRWAPLDRERHPIAVHPVACSPCSHWTCPIDHACLRGITAQSVLACARSLLARYPRQTSHTSEMSAGEMSAGEMSQPLEVLPLAGPSAEQLRLTSAPATNR